MLKFSFVILHYQNLEDTCNCVNSIMKQKNYSNVSIEIIIVDNHSPNNSGEKLKEMYKKNGNIKFILLNDNIGFSKANNIGYKFARDNKTDLIIMLNNDIVIEDNSFIDKLYDFEEKNKDYYIISPDIVNKEGYHQSPLRKNYTSIKTAYKIMFRNFFVYGMTYIPVIRKVISIKEKEKIKKWLNKRYEKANVDDIYDFVPFGAFIIYTKKWIENEEIAFPSDTFMFAEEDYLSYYIKLKKYPIIYNNNLKVKHLDSNSFNSLGNIYKKIRFRSKNMALAKKKYIRFLKKNRRCKSDFSNYSNL